MSERRSDWRVIVGVGLVIWGGWWLLNGVLAPLFWPLRAMLQFVSRIGWPLVIIAVGVFLIVMARRDWRPVAGGKRLARSRSDRMVGGVVGGLAQYLGADPTLLRVVYATLMFLTGFFWALVLYGIAMIVIPDDPAPASPHPGASAQPPTPPTSPTS